MRHHMGMRKLFSLMIVWYALASGSAVAQTSRPAPVKPSPYGIEVYGVSRRPTTPADGSTSVRAARQPVKTGGVRD